MYYVKCIKMTSIVKHHGDFSVTMTIGHQYYAVVHPDTAEWHCFGITNEGTYKITCNGVDDYTVVEEEPPRKQPQEGSEYKVHG